MLAGDLGTWEQQHTIIVMEGVLCAPLWRGRIRRTLADAEEWGWSIVGLRTIQRHAYASIPIDVITFLGQEVADHAAAWLNRYDIEVASVEAADLGAFCRSLAWRHNDVQRVIDSDTNRLDRYGQKGYSAIYGGEF